MLKHYLLERVVKHYVQNVEDVLQQPNQGEMGRSFGDLGLHLLCPRRHISRHGDASWGRMSAIYQC